MMRAALSALVLLLSPWVRAQGASQATPADPRWRPGPVLYSDDFKHGLAEWRIEAEKPGKIEAQNGALDIDVPAGVTVWLRREFDGPVMITYDATVISAGGPNDRVSDLNSFWMASDPTVPDDLFAHARTGAFAGYNTLRMYYVGLGGNGNKTTRFRRYIGDAVERPLLPENDLSAVEHPDKMIVANRSQHVTLIADGNLIQYWRGAEKIFEMNDPEPYTRGWFGIRTTKSHLQVRNLRILRLSPTQH